MQYPADSDFRGTIKALVESHDTGEVVLLKGEAYFQMLVIKISTDELVLATELGATGRQTGQFGSTTKAQEPAADISVIFTKGPKTPPRKKRQPNGDEDAQDKENETQEPTQTME